MSHPSLKILAIYVVLFATSCFAAPLTGDGWVFLRDGGTGRAPRLSAAGPLARFSVTIEIPGLETGRDEGYVTVRIPGQARLMEAGAPELPLVATTVALPDHGMPVARLTVLEESTFDLTGKIQPSRGHFERNTPPELVPLHQGPAYSRNAFFPAQDYPVTVDRPFILRDFRATSLRVAPVLYNPATGKLRVLRKARLDVSLVASADSVNDKRRQDFAICAEFSPIYQRTLLNYDAALQSLSHPVETAGRSLVICPDEWADNLAPLLAWRKAKGQDTRLVKVSEISGGKGLTAEQTKTFLQGDYKKGGLTFVLLVGDADRMPTLKGVKEKADSDACLAKLDGDDHVPDVFISRFSANKPAELDTQVARALSYDKTPLTSDGASFYKKAIGIASNQGSPKDWQRCDQLRESLLHFRYTDVDKVYDPSASASKVVEMVNAGRSMINYIGHGSKYSWVTTGFKKAHIDQLTNSQGWWPMIWSVACVNGDFARGSDCFAESWAKAGTADHPAGCIGMVAASTNMAWVPPCDWQSAIVTQYMASETAWTGGALHLLGLVKAMEKWGTDAKSEGVRLVEQCIFFGDASVSLRNDTPRAAQITVETAGRRALTLKVETTGRPVAGARICLTPAADQAPVVALTGADGRASLEVVNGPTPLGEVKVTVTGPNLLPILDRVLRIPATPPPSPKAPVAPER